MLPVGLNSLICSSVECKLLSNFIDLFLLENYCEEKLRSTHSESICEKFLTVIHQLCSGGGAVMYLLLG